MKYSCYGTKVTCCLQNAYLSERGSKDVRKRWTNRYPSISHDRFPNDADMKSWEKHGMGNLVRYYPLNAGSLGHQIMTLS